MDSERARARGRIAVIDDDAIFVELMRDLLADAEGYEVLTAPHWRESIELVREARPDLIILDLMLGATQTGWGVLKMLREDPLMATIPVILCSAATPVLSYGSAAQTGHAAIEALPKPFDVDHLLELVERLLADPG